jgi:putative Mg2+ transporter-C (MgtC) family protein
MPSKSYAYHYIRFDRTEAMSEAAIRVLLAEHGYSVADMGDHITCDGPSFEYRMTIRTTDPNNTAHLAASLRKLELVREFRISPMGDRERIQCYLQTGYSRGHARLDICRAT